MPAMSEIELKFGFTDRAAAAVERGAAPARRACDGSSRTTGTAPTAASRTRAVASPAQIGDGVGADREGGGASPRPRGDRGGPTGGGGPLPESRFSARRGRAAARRRARAAQARAASSSRSPAASSAARHASRRAAPSSKCARPRRVYVRRAVVPVCEVEAELKRGDVARAGRRRPRHIDAHGMWLSTVSKARRAERLAARARRARPRPGRPVARGERRGDLSRRDAQLPRPGPRQCERARRGRDR